MSDRLKEIEARAKTSRPNTIDGLRSRDSILWLVDQVRARDAEIGRLRDERFELRVQVDWMESELTRTQAENAEYREALGEIRRCRWCRKIMPPRGSLRCCEATDGDGCMAGEPEPTPEQQRAREEQPRAPAPGWLEVHPLTDGTTLVSVAGRWLRVGRVDHETGTHWTEQWTEDEARRLLEGDRSGP